MTSSSGQTVTLASLREHKAKARQNAHTIRDAQTDKDGLSRVIQRTLCALEEYQRAACLGWYLHIRSEVRTQDIVQEILGGRQRIGIPYCQDKGQRRTLTFWALDDFSQLAPGHWGILEPLPSVRADPHRQLHPVEDLDLVVVPGVAFTEGGARLGNGAGYYDRFLSDTNSLRVAVAFECQIRPELPTGPHDLPMDIIVTECRVIRTHAR